MGVSGVVRMASAWAILLLAARHPGDPCRGAAVAISTLRPGDTATAVDTVVGKTETQAVMVKWDTDLYNLLVTWNPSAEGPVGRRPSSPARIPT